MEKQNRDMTCSLSGELKSVEKVEADAAPQKSELELTAEKLGITPSKLKAMREYAINLRKSDRRMKEAAIRRKVCEKFKVKLV